MDGVIVLYGLMGGVNVDGPLLAMILGMSIDCSSQRMEQKSMIVLNLLS